MLVIIDIVLGSSLYVDEKTNFIVISIVTNTWVGSQIISHNTEVRIIALNETVLINYKKQIAAGWFVAEGITIENETDWLIKQLFAVIRDICLSIQECCYRNTCRDKPKASIKSRLDPEMCTDILICCHIPSSKVLGE